MPDLQATWTPEGTLFFWSPDGPVDDAIGEDLPRLYGAQPVRTRRSLARPGVRVQRKRLRGIEAPVSDVLRLLAHIPRDAHVSDSLRTWAMAARLALELAARQRVAPTVRNGEARWRALLTRPEDQCRFEALVDALPAASRSVPTRERGKLHLCTPEIALSGFIDAAVDGVYRQHGYPGPGRGWALEFADALRGESPEFTPREARFQGVPEMLAGWSSEAEVAGLRLGMRLRLPSTGTERFRLELWLHPRGRPELEVPITRAWEAGPALEIGDEVFPHPAHAAMRGLARAVRVFPALADCLHGRHPQPVSWTPTDVWSFLSEGLEPLRSAGFTVEIPSDFSEAGHQRLRARMRIEARLRTDGSVDLSNLLRFHWEVFIGETVVDGAEFAELCAMRAPVVKFRGNWVLLDPAEIDRLPEGLPKDGTLPAITALRAVLCGEHEGVPVVADRELASLVETLGRPGIESIPATLHGQLRPYQHRGYSWLTTLGRLGLGACLADDMGLGKTIQLIAHLLSRKAAGAGPSLVVCPTSVLSNWAREISRFGPSLRSRRYHGLDRQLDDLPATDVVLTTYGLLVRDAELLQEVDWDVVVLDEAQSIKNPDSQRARSARGLKAHHRVALTGTPIENRLDELWSLLEFLVPGLLGPRARFRRTIALPIERFGDEGAAEQLKRSVAPFLLRRVKTDPRVITDLPDKIERRVFCPLTREQAALYERVVEEFMERISHSEDIERRGQVLAMLTALKQVCNHPDQYLGGSGPLAGRSGKLERLTDLFDAIFDRGERVLLFTQYREMGSRLQRYLLETYGEEAPFLHGGTPPHHRDEMVRAFQHDDNAPPLLLISLRAGGTGLNLTRASHVIHYDRWWNPAVEDQATDRAYRIGQHKNVMVHKFIAPETLEERIDHMLEEKRALAEQVVGGGERWVTELDNDALRRLVALGHADFEEDE